MEFSYIFSAENECPFDKINWVKKTATIKDNKTGNIVFEMDDISVPDFWSQSTADIAASKYFRKDGIMELQGLDLGEGVFTQIKPTPDDLTPYENCASQMYTRIVDFLTSKGYSSGIQNASERKSYHNELLSLLLNQYAAYNSPVWFNVGLFHKYGIFQKGTNWGFIGYNGLDEPVFQVIENRLEKPQSAACFIGNIEDDMDSIMECARQSAMIFKGGSGHGANYSNLRAKGENLSSGGKSSGLMSFLRPLDAFAGAIKSGGTTRRAARNVIVDIDHPEIIDFIKSKSREEEKCKALLATGNYGDPLDMENEALNTVAFQNANHNIRVSDDFLISAKEGNPWNLLNRVDGRVNDTVYAGDLMDMISENVWKSGDPGLYYADNVEKMNTCKASGTIVGSNPCQEFVFLNDTACNLASLSLPKFINKDGTFDLKRYLQAIRLMIFSQDTLVDESSYPTKEIARNSHLFRPLGLGYAGLADFLMRLDLPYDSELARAWAATLASILTGYGYLVSSDIAEEKGSFSEYEKNKDSFLWVMRMHFDHAEELHNKHSDGLVINDKQIRECFLDSDNLDLNLLLCVQRYIWFEVCKRDAFRNAQISVIAPTGCLVPETVIQTEKGNMSFEKIFLDQGYTLDHLKTLPGDTWLDVEKPIKVRTTSGFRDISKLYVNGFKKSYRISSKDKLLAEGSGNSQFLVKIDTKTAVWKRFDELKKGDKIIKLK